MKFLFSAPFWGILILLFGVNIFVNSVLFIYIPFFKMFIGFIIVFVGVNIIFSKDKSGGAFLKSKNFDKSDIQKKYKIIFASSTIDLTDIKSTDVHKIEIETIFAETKIFINKDTKIFIHSSTAFGQTVLPSGISRSFGNTEETLGSDDESGQAITVETNTLFGSVQIIYKDS